MGSRRQSQASLSPGLIRETSEKIFSELSESKWLEAKEFLKNRNKSKLINSDFRKALFELIEAEEAFCSDLGTDSKYS